MNIVTVFNKCDRGGDKFPRLIRNCSVMKSVKFKTDAILVERVRLNLVAYRVADTMESPYFMNTQSALRELEAFKI